jgi:hypothetical protein
MYVYIAVNSWTESIHSPCHFTTRPLPNVWGRSSRPSSLPSQAGCGMLQFIHNLIYVQTWGHLQAPLWKVLSTYF